MIIIVGIMMFVKQQNKTRSRVAKPKQKIIIIENNNNNNNN